MTSERVSSEERGIHRQHDRADTHAKSFFLGNRIGEPHRLPRIIYKKEDEQDRQVKKVPMNVLHDEREGIFAAIGFPWFGYGAGGRVGPE